MLRTALYLVIFGVIMGGCAGRAASYTKNDIVKITDFELSPDESKVAFSAVTPVGNLDIWVVNIDGKNLKKLTFEDHSPTNHIARFFKKYHWANYFEIDMHSPKWTGDGRIAFCQELKKYEMWGPRTISKRFRTIKPDGTDKKPQTDLDKVIHSPRLQSGLSIPPKEPGAKALLGSIKQESPIHINRFKFSSRSEKNRITILLKNDYLWILRDGEITPKKLIQ